MDFLRLLRPVWEEDVMVSKTEKKKTTRDYKFSDEDFAIRVRSTTSYDIRITTYKLRVDFI